ncbi:MAG: leucine-rich repeat protein [Pseudobutyrivibrio sp.]|nr:leucine-rich repeat protein [Pseudobutyrivibrio sp.]
MRRGTKLGWLLVGMSVVLCGWTIAADSVNSAEFTEEEIDIVEAEPAALLDESNVEYVNYDDQIMLMSYRTNDNCDFDDATGTLTINDGAVIGDSEFANDTNITSIVVAEGANVTIGTNSFSGCTNLESVNLGSATMSQNGTLQTTFAECYNIKSINGAGYESQVKTDANDTAGGIVYDSNKQVVYFTSGAGVDSYVDDDPNPVRCIYLDPSTTGVSVDSYYALSSGGSDKPVYIIIPDGMNIDDVVTPVNGNYIVCYKDDAKIVPVNPTPIPTITTTPVPSGQPTATPTVSPSGTPTTTPSITPTITPTVGPNNGGGGNNGGSSGGSSSGSSSDTSNGGSSNNGGGAYTTVTYKIAPDGTVIKGHAKDNTPKTADGFDERYLLCLAVFLCGVGVLIISKNKKYAIISSMSDID